MRDYHHCASCQYYDILIEPGIHKYNRCTRTGWDTNPKAVMNCWQPKDRVKELMERERIAGSQKAMD